MRDALRQAPGLPSLSSLRPCSGSTPSEVEWSKEGTDVEIDDDGPARVLYEGSS